MGYPILEFGGGWAFEVGRDCEKGRIGIDLDRQTFELELLERRVMLSGTGQAVMGPADVVLEDEAVVVDGVVEGAQSDPFTLVVLPDTQRYSERGPAPFNAQTQWVADHVLSENLVFLTHVGDLVENGGEGTDRNQVEWDRANAAMSILDGDLGVEPDGLIPYSAVPGNHDYDKENKHSEGHDRFVEFFGASRYSGRSWYFGSSPDELNHYQVFEAGGMAFLHIGLEWEARDSSLAWAQSVIDSHSSLPAIVTTHSYLNHHGIHSSERQTSDGNSGMDIFRKLISPNPQIFMVFNGHFSGEARQVSMNDAGSEVFELLANFQDRSNWADGYLRLVEFLPEEDRIDVRTYSPLLGRYETDSDSQFSLAIDFDERFDFGPTAGIARPVDGGEDDLDPDDGAVTVYTYQSSFDFQLDGIAYEIDDGTVTRGMVELIKDSEVQVEGVDYEFIYDAEADVIRLLPGGELFENGEYVITLNGLNSGTGRISDLGGQEIETTMVAITIDTALQPPIVPATHYVVNSLLDVLGHDSLLTLREAILAANLNIELFDAPAGSPDLADQITFDPALFHENEATITLSGSHLFFSDSVYLYAPVNNHLTIDADSRSRVFNIPGQSSIEVKLSNLTITGGDTSDDGGGIYNTANLTINNSRIIGNVAGGNGGGIANDNGGELTINNVVLSGNHAGIRGGGINSHGGTTVVNSTVVGNSSAAIGGGILRGDGDLTVNNSIVALNDALVIFDISASAVMSSSLVGVNPGFVREPWVGDDFEWGTEDDDYGDLRLLESSPAVNGGDEFLLPMDAFDLDGDGDVGEFLPIDLDGGRRISGGRVDIGAYELQGPGVHVAIVPRVEPSVEVRSSVVPATDGPSDGAFWRREGGQYYLEIWIRSDELMADFVTEGGVGVAFDPSIAGLVGVDHGPIYTDGVSSVVDLVEGTVFVGGRDAVGSHGRDEYVLFGRLLFEGHAPIDPVGQSFGPFSMGLSVDAEETWFSFKDVAEVPDVIAMVPKVSVRANPYDFDNNGVVNFADMGFFLPAMGLEVGGSEPAYAVWADFDGDGVVGVADRDLILEAIGRGFGEVGVPESARTEGGGV